jgi:proline dehydrogenase
MLMAHIRTLADARAKRQNARLEKFAEALGRKFAEERAANRREIEQLRADVEALRDALMLPKGASAGERRVQ